MAETSKLAHLLSRLRSYFIFVPLVFLYTGVLGLASLLSSFFDRDGRAQHNFARLWSWVILKTCLAPVTITGLERVDISQSHLYVVNHLSAMDIPVLYAHLPFAFRILAKKELFRYPFLGWHLRRSGQIPVDVGSALASVRTMNRAVDTLRAGTPLVVFPEGGRAPDGHIMPFQRGAFYAAIKAQVEIVPMALIGTFETLPMNTYHVMPRPLQLIVGQPITTSGYTTRDMDKLASEAQAAVEELYYANSHVPDPRQNANAAVPGGVQHAEGSETL
ncbi:MAG TPA: lysophospholipid acyltransferase family protein [Terriglobales bacterium]|nr:lysophospholipid acyltransferase family protein [Terriglobales bacterium]